MRGRGAADPVAPDRPLRERLAWDTARGAIADGPRRYLMMRPDVLMGMLRALPPDARTPALDAFAASAGAHGVDSVRAYFRRVGEDPAALLEATAAAARDLGWGAWSFAAGRGRLALAVDGSPFAEGFGASDAPVCAPIRGLLAAVAGVATGVELPASDVRELRCRACGDPRCEFEATWPAC